MGLWSARSSRIYRKAGSTTRGRPQARHGCGRHDRLRGIQVMTTPADYTASEIMTVAAARSLAGTRTVFVGVGLPNLACNLAQRTVAPDLQLIYESGVYGARPARLPLSIGDPTLVTGAISVVPMADLFGYYLQGGLVDVALLGG